MNDRVMPDGLARQAVERACPGIEVRCVRPVAAGHSGDHWLVDTDDGRLLLKVPRRITDPGHFRHLVAAANRAVEAGLPVPRFRSFVPFDEIVGGPVLVQEYVPGRMATEAWPHLTPAERHRVSAQIGELVARLHQTKGDALTDVLGDRPYPSIADYAEKILRQALAETTDVSLDVVGGWKSVETVVRSAVERIGVVEPTLVHLDLYLDNILLAEDGAEVAAIIDFEHARFSDQYEEFGKITDLLFDWHPQTREPFLRAYADVHPLDDQAWQRIDAHVGLYNVRMCGYFRRWQPNLVADYQKRIAEWMADR
ncbi:phosphotransferase family protein [Fodinicola acaciae]|uniref:phosphotransferase family protein n=1 Tax=Fodinicola acaciae TaxID=2681555 RepID=UPI0013D8857A|nr:aminoglycoside phosphotransferase family protein [Fodinicola acaciae]